MGVVEDERDGDGVLFVVVMNEGLGIGVKGGE